MKITRRNAVLCVLWAVFNHEHLYSWTEKFCGFLDKVIIQKQWKQWKQRKKK